MTTSPGQQFYQHGLRRVTGRDTGERHRAASVLELFFDLNFVTAFGTASSQLAHGIAEGHSGGATIAFLIAVLAIVWAWTGYTWLASAFDNDDWLFRLLTLVQMAGVIVLAIGIPSLFRSIEEGHHFSGTVMVAGYVVMRVAVIAQWLRVAVDDRDHRGLAITSALVVAVAQCLWVLFILLPLSLEVSLGLIVVFWLIDLAGPLVAEAWSRRHGAGGSPWHAHHIAERYSLLAIIAIGETITGTLAAAQEISQSSGWTTDAVVVIAVGVLISFALWWTYFLIPSGPVLDARRDKVAPWAYGHSVLFASIAAVGAGLHVTGYVYAEDFHVSTLTAIMSISIPVLVFMICIYALHTWLVGSVSRNPAHVITFAAPIAASLLAATGWPLWACLLIVAASPVAVIISYELFEWRWLAAQLDEALARGGDARISG
ncbi:low temperature requirement protein A [Gordonia sputi]